MARQNQTNVESKVPEASYSGLSVAEALKKFAAAINYGTMSWIANEIPIPKPEKELTEKQLFTKIKKELKEVKKLIN
jgi:hypothetical protein